MTSRRRGSASLLLAIVTGASLVVFSVFLNGARIREAESALLRAVSVASDATLSAYCGVLLQRYGLFAFQAEEGDAMERAEAVFHSGLPARAGDARLVLEPLDPLGDPGVLATGIRRFVLERVPALLLARGLQRWSGLARVDGVVGFDPLFDSGEGSGAEEDEWQEALLAAMENGTTTSGPAGPSPDDPGYDMADASRDLRDSLLAIGEINRSTAGDASIPSLPSPLDPDALGSFLDRNFAALPSNVQALVDSVAVDVYAVSMFRSRVMEATEDGVRHACVDLRGRPLSGLTTVREDEVEFLIAGHATDEENVAGVERRLLALRLALHLLDQMEDEQARERARAFGEALSALLSAATSGTLVLPAGFLAVAIQVAWAYGAAVKDVRGLVEGLRVAVLPDALGRLVPELASWTAGYGDYLALLLVAVPDSVKLDRIAATIAENVALFGAAAPFSIGGSPLSGYFTAVRASTVYRQQAITCTARYGDVVP